MVTMEIIHYGNYCSKYVATDLSVFECPCDTCELACSISGRYYRPV